MSTISDLVLVFLTVELRPKLWSQSSRHSRLLSEFYRLSRSTQEQCRNLLSRSTQERHRIVWVVRLRNSIVIFWVVQLQVWAQFPKFSCAAIFRKLKNVAKVKHMFPKVFGKHATQIKPSAIAFSSSSSQNFIDTRFVAEKNATLNLKMKLQQNTSFLSHVQHKIAKTFAKWCWLFSCFSFFHAHVLISAKPCYFLAAKKN